MVGSHHFWFVRLEFVSFTDRNIGRHDLDLLLREMDQKIRCPEEKQLYHFPSSIRDIH